MSIAEMISRSAANTSDMVNRITVPALDAPTTCAQWDFAALANHLTGFLGYSANAARRGAPLDGDAPNFVATPDWKQQFAALASDLAEAWSEPGAIDGEVSFGPGQMPASYAASITLLELVVHGWDLARSSGTSYEVDDDIAEAVAQIVARAAAGGPSDFFGEPVAVGPDAAPLERALAQSGRNPFE